MAEDQILEIKLPDIRKIEQRLGAMQSKAGQVMSRAINRAMDLIHRSMSDEARKEYIVKSGAAKKTLSIHKAKASSLSGSIISRSDKKVALIGFKAKPAKRAPKPPEFYQSQVKQASSLKSLSGSADRSKGFVATMASGHTGVFERTGRKTSTGRPQIAELFGPAIPHMFSFRNVSDKIKADAQKKLHERIDYEVGRLLEASK